MSAPALRQVPVDAVLLIILAVPDHTAVVGGMTSVPAVKVAENDGDGPVVEAVHARHERVMEHTEGLVEMTTIHRLIVNAEAVTIPAAAGHTVTAGGTMFVPVTRVAENNDDGPVVEAVHARHERVMEHIGDPAQIVVTTMMTMIMIHPLLHPVRAVPVKGRVEAGAVLVLSAILV